MYKCASMFEMREHTPARSILYVDVCVRDEIAEQLTYFHEFHYAVHCTTKNDECILKWNDSHFVTVIEKNLNAIDRWKNFYNVWRKLLEFPICLSRIALSGMRFKTHTHTQRQTHIQ